MFLISWNGTCDRVRVCTCLCVSVRVCVCCGACRAPQVSIWRDWAQTEKGGLEKALAAMEPVADAIAVHGTGALVPSCTCPGS